METATNNTTTQGTGFETKNAANFWGGETEWKDEPVKETATTEDKKTAEATANEAKPKITREMAEISGRVASTLYTEVHDTASELLLMLQFNRQCAKLGTDEEIEQAADIIDKEDNNQPIDVPISPPIQNRMSKLRKLLKWEETSREKMPLTAIEKEDLKTAAANYFEIKQADLPPEYMLLFAALAPILNRGRVLLMPI